ncbi:chromate efflux transporter [Flavobacterium salilacus subsp. salilacus]|uniref:chromate efflux transporter n=1 Tax=Flavobacterium TaxID=237 RepID=UPI00107560E9|nr:MULTISPECIES: chromate efflux transporter [Flavobacterium]KAF2519386.1 chromate efflux transporter [Flavobacterium salilacus subsp. salilacus]MBE1614722.1 chromate efflux transporter [Flavobacterium sp. SaA2.13]
MLMEANLKEVLFLFTRLGVTAFGGSAAHIAMMRHEVVKQRQWMDDASFLDLMGATNLIPGPNSTELAIHLGKERAGWKGLITAGFFFIFPAVLITCIFAWLYKEYGSLPYVKPFIYGIKPAVIAVILMAVFPMGRAALKNKVLAFLAIAVVILALSGYHEIILLFGSGLVYMVYVYTKRNRQNLNSFFPALFAGSYHTVTNTDLFLIFLKIGSVLYGSGYVLFAFIDTELVATGILSRQQLIDAIAVGQFTPGPVFSSVTFIGYQVNGFSGALVATVGVFLPSFIFVALLNSIMGKLKRSELFASFLDAVNVASVAVIAAVCWFMGQESIINWQTAVIALSSLIFLIFYPKLNTAFIVLYGSILGYFLTLM